MYDPRNWYWLVTGQNGVVFSSSSATYVAISDSTYQIWLTAMGLPSRIDSEDALAEVLEDAAPDIVPQFPAGLAAYANRKQAALAAGGVTVNAAPTLVTNGTTASGNATLHFASVPAWVSSPMPIADVTTPSAIPGGRTVSSTTGTTIVMSGNAAGAGVGGTDIIKISVPVFCATDPDSKADLNGLVLLAQIDSTFTTQWPPRSATPITLTAPQIIAMGVAVGLFVQATFTTLATVLSGIAAVTITTKAQIDAAAWPATS